jgi:hypothetical protein
VLREWPAHVFQAVEHPELDTLGLVAIRDFLKKRSRYMRLVAQNNKADGVNVTPITVVASIDPELLENLIDMEKIVADSVDDCTDEDVMEFLESTQERDASITAEFVKAEVLAKVTFAVTKKDPTLRVMKAVADYYSLHRNLRLRFVNGKPMRAVGGLESVIRLATLKFMIEIKLEMDKPPPCLNTKKCAGEKHYLSDCPHTGNDKAIVPLSKNKKREMPTRRSRTSKLWATTVLPPGPM